jgi:hypothetical protein
MRVSSEIPGRALDALRDIDWSNAVGGHISWDDESGRWTLAKPDDEE